MLHIFSEARQRERQRSKLCEGPFVEVKVFSRLLKTMIEIELLFSVIHMLERALRIGEARCGCEHVTASISLFMEFQLRSRALQVG